MSVSHRTVLAVRLLVLTVMPLVVAGTTFALGDAQQWAVAWVLVLGAVAVFAAVAVPLHRVPPSARPAALARLLGHAPGMRPATAAGDVRPVREEGGYAPPLNPAG
ncbi:hypothetical protein [Cellulomonas endophytica]|uniref:hypothetical protein n=1 Tax=Cellulomonas endophytica TaxID=2494735 RepID=UPI0010122791|nr:hypothetical protein [Cellulomonas endophytica]